VARHRLQTKGYGSVSLNILGSSISLCFYGSAENTSSIQRKFGYKKTLSAMASDSILENGEEWEIRKSFNERADIDDISSVNGGDLEIDKEDGKIVLGIAYSVKTPLFENIYLYIDFNESSGK
jgi:hypothetical protein